MMTDKDPVTVALEVLSEMDEGRPEPRIKVLAEAIVAMVEERAAVQRLINNAEEIRQDKYTFKVVHTRDLEAVLAGRLR